MNWYRKAFKMRPTYFRDFPFSAEPLMIEVDEPTSPSFDEWMALIQGIEMWLSDPIGQQNRCTHRLFVERYHHNGGGVGFENRYDECTKCGAITNKVYLRK